MRRVAILTPAYGHSVDAYYHHSVIDTIKACARQGIDVLPLTWPGEALVQHARNALAKMALQSPVDDVFWIDADQEWLPIQFLELLNHEVDVVGAAYRKKTDDAEQYTVRNGKIGVTSFGLWEVTGLGTGFLRMTREALETVYEQSEAYTNNGETWRNVFDVRVMDGRLWGEDTILCEKLSALNYTIYLDPSFTVGHNGYKRYKGDFRAWAQQARTQHEANHAQRAERPGRGDLHAAEATPGSPSLRDGRTGGEGGGSVVGEAHRAAESRSGG